MNPEPFEGPSTRVLKEGGALDRTVLACEFMVHQKSLGLARSLDAKDCHAWRSQAHIGYKTYKYLYICTYIYMYICICIYIYIHI